MIVLATQLELRNLLRRVRGRKYRPMRQWVEEELVVPDGRFAGQLFRTSTQPFTGLLFDAIDSGQWNSFVVVGPSQSGKTLSAFVAPILYHLFERRETVLVGCPTLDIVADKWKQDILPAIEASPYRRFLPRSGEGARGGRVKSMVQFAHGPTLRFMTGGGDDKSRSAFSSRVLVLTEAEGFDETGTTSKESTKLKQLFARQRAHPRDMRVTYAECTVTDQSGYSWRNYLRGTASRIVCPCPHCDMWVQPEREHLRGWQDAEDDYVAEAEGHFVCPACSVPIDESDQAQMNHRAQLIHEGQDISDDGTVTGEAKHTRQLGFRWGAFNNLFLSAADHAADEWAAEREESSEAAEKELVQFVWATPWIEEEVSLVPLSREELSKHTGGRRDTRGVVPRDTEFVTVGVDPAKWYVWYAVTAWISCDDVYRGHVVDANVLDVPADDMDADLALAHTLREMEDWCNGGWVCAETGNARQPDLVICDSGYKGTPDSKENIVYTWCREANKRAGRVKGLPLGMTYFPSKGAGELTYHAPSSKSKTVKAIGLNYHIKSLMHGRHRVFLLEYNADRWKTWVHQRLSTPIGETGSMSLYNAPRRELTKLAAHLTAERAEQEFVPGRGVVTKFKQIRASNHWLDCTSEAAIAGHMRGFRIMDRNKPVSPSVSATPRESSKFVLQGGRQWR